MKKNITRVAIEGAYGEGNFGDDALLHVALKYILQIFKKAEITVLTIEPPLSYMQSRFPCVHKVKWKRRVLNAKWDIKVYGGGTQLFRFSESSGVRSRFKLAIKNPSYVISYIVHKVYSSDTRQPENTYYLGVGLGPFEGVDVKEYINNRLGSRAHVFVRDEASKLYLERARDCKGKSYADICFLEEYPQYKRSRNHIKKIAVILRDWRHSAFNQNPQLIYDALSPSYDVSFVFFGRDKSLADEAKKTEANVVIYDPDNYKHEEFVGVLASYDLIVSARFHALVYGVILGIPSIALGIEPKLEIAAKQFGLPLIKNMNDLTTIFINSMDCQALQSHLEKVRTVNKDLASEMFKDFAKAVELRV